MIARIVESGWYMEEESIGYDLLRYNFTKNGFAVQATNQDDPDAVWKRLVSAV